MMKLKVIVLTGSSIPNLNTLTTLISGDINVVGAVICNQKKLGINWKFFKNSFKKIGFTQIILQIISRIIHNSLFGAKEKKIFNALFDRDKINYTIQNWKGPILKTKSFDSIETFNWIKNIAKNMAQFNRIGFQKRSGILLAEW